MFWYVNVFHAYEDELVGGCEKFLLFALSHVSCFSIVLFLDQLRRYCSLTKRDLSMLFNLASRINIHFKHTLVRCPYLQIT